jgi:hypothetical protein
MQLEMLYKFGKFVSVSRENVCFFGIGLGKFMKCDKRGWQISVCGSTAGVVG